MDVMAFWVSKHIAHEVQAHTHEFYQMIFCMQPGGYITIGSRRHKAWKDHVYLAAPGVLHAIENTDGLYVAEFKFEVTGADVTSLACLPAYYDVLDLPMGRELLMTVMEEGLSKGTHYYEAANAAMKLFLIQSVRKFSALQPDNDRNDYSQSAILDVPRHPREHGENKVLNLKYYIADRMAETITLEQLAAELNYSESYLIRQFRTAFGMPPMKYVNFLRLNRARELLLQTKLSVAQIGSCVGFALPHYFSRSFRAAEGMSPREYRKLHKKGE